MARISWIFVLFLAANVAEAYELGDNPAFCAGFLAMQSDRDASRMRTHEAAIKNAFGRSGPKDSTDGRGYIEWLHVGIEAARDKSADDYDATAKRCAALIERIVQ
jgi:hypothetical protein